MQPESQDQWRLTSSGRKKPPLTGRAHSRRPADLELMLDFCRQEVEALTASLELARKEAEEARLRLREVDHRAKNSLQLAAAMLQLQANDVQEPVARTLISAAIQRLRSLAAVHQVLYQSMDGEGVRMDVWLNTICEGLAINPDVQVVVSAPDENWPVALAGPLGLMAAEATTNALKHAYSAGAGGVVSIELSSLEGGDWRLRISDDGVGQSVKEGLGMRLMRMLARQVGGSLEVTRGAHCGLVISTTFPGP